MLEAIGPSSGLSKNIRLNKVSYSNQYNRDIKYGSFNSYPLNFKGYHQIEPYNFSKTVEDNYFQLPSITLYTGEEKRLLPDKSQIDCAKKLYQGDSVLYCAPTGSGKTAVAHYIITKNLKENKKTIYTTPLKALANDKLREFKKIYGEDNVGLLTGDIKINPRAPIQIMTAEIYNNQIPNLNSKNTATVIFDEVHYIGAQDRGNVWEQAIINSSDKDIQMLLLSATIGNSNALGSWIQKINSLRAIEKVEVAPKERFVPLIWQIHALNNPKEGAKDKTGHFIDIEDYEVNLDDIKPENLEDKQKRALEIIFKSENKIEGNVILSNEQYVSLAQNLIEKFETIGNYNIFDKKDFKDFILKFYPFLDSVQAREITELLIDRSSKEINEIELNHHKDNYPELINDLKRENMLPALIFKLSKSQTKEIITDLKEARVDLNSKEEKEKIEKILDEYKKENIYLGNNFDKEAILKGYAYHHAGELPQYRKLIEELFSKKLIKVVSATSTLSAGINMPAKSVIISDIIYKKFNPLTNSLEEKTINPNEFQQMAGRAGRRGIDNLGYVVLYNLDTKPKTLKYETKEETQENKTDELQLAYTLLKEDSSDLRSVFSPEWALLAQKFEKGEENFDDLINKSFKAFLSDDDIKIINTLHKNFEKYKTVLEKSDFIKNSKGKISITPKGQILSRSQSANPLLLAELIYDEQLKDVDIFDLCQIAGYLASSDVQEDNEEIEKIIQDRFDLLYPDFKDKKEAFENFNKIKNKVQNRENKILRIELQNRISKQKLIKTDSFGGFICYIWSKLNDKNQDTIKNFKALTGSVDNALTQEDIKRLGEVSYLYNRKALEGNIYKIISQSVSILNRINQICNFALSNPEIYPNQDYYKKLQETAELALILMKQNPIFDETQL